jgi:hypothetical protein
MLRGFIGSNMNFRVAAQRSGGSFAGATVGHAASSADGCLRIRQEGGA